MTTIKICSTSGDMLTGIGCFKGTFSLKVKDTKPYQVPPRCVPYALQEPLKRTRKTIRKVDTGR